MKPFALISAIALACAATSTQAQNVTTADGHIVMVEKNQAVTGTTLVGGLTVGTAVIGAVTLAIIIGAVSGEGT